MRTTILLLAWAAAMLFLSPVTVAAGAPDGIAIHNLPDSGNVTVSGTVDRVESARKFTLRDNTGTIDVAIKSNESAVLSEGDKVTVTGNVSSAFWGLMKGVNATDVQVHKDLPTVLSDALTETTGISVDKTTVSHISQLPDQGLVRVTGSVDKVGNEKNFTLKDSTGTIDVAIASAEKVVLVKGAEVTVVGYVKRGMMGKTLSATHVILTSDSSAETSSIKTP